MNLIIRNYDAYNFDSKNAQAQFRINRKFT